ncbi:uncharacterized protein [Diadema antillarum]|uniref:uncharacterized protein n=1 Tax=Diadema antillarum TaxID=105358 RepID=UPI003A89AEDC
MADSVPVIDFSAYSIDRESPDPARIQELVDDVYSALTTIGFMYLKNHGIPQKKIDDVFHTAKQFLSLSAEAKRAYVRPADDKYGYFEMERERLNPARPFNDLKETFNYCPSTSSDIFPDEEVPEFRGAMLSLFDASKLLHNRTLEIIAMGLGLDQMFFVNMHSSIGTPENLSCMRALYYPSLTNVEVKRDQVRCGEHSDYGGITLLFQDDQGGLEVKNCHDCWIPAPPIEGTVLVNIGDLMQRWTSDKLIACKHRVMIPDNPARRRHDRQSIAFFGIPDESVIAECVDGSNKYPPVKTSDYIKMKFTAATIETSKPEV